MKNNVFIKYFFFLPIFLLIDLPASQYNRFLHDNISFLCSENIIKTNFSSNIGNFINDDSCNHNKVNKFFWFNDKLDKFHRFDVDSLMKKFKAEIELDKFFNEDFLKKFDNNLPEQLKELPEFDDERLNEMLKELNKNFNQDSLLKKFKYFNRKNLFDKSELTEI